MRARVFCDIERLESWLLARQSCAVSPPATRRKRRGMVDAHYDYMPVMPADVWERIRDFVQKTVRDAAPATAYTEKQLFPVTAKLARWAVDVAALPLNTEVLFDSDTIDEFAHAGLITYTSAGRSTMRSKLRAIARALDPSAEDRDQAGIKRSAPVRPYTPADVAALESWARGQHSRDRRTSAAALLALGLGAGLTGREIVAAKAADLDTSGNLVLVRVRGENQREVPVLREWEHVLQGPRGEDGWVFRSGQQGGNPNLITDFVSRSHQRLNVQARRLRATWLVHHLTVGTRLPVLLAAAGLQSAEALDRLLPFVPEADQESAREMLRG